MLGAALLALTGCASLDPGPSGSGPALAPSGVELGGVPFFPQEDYQCGPAALATLLVYSGVAITPDALVPQVYLPERKGSLQVELVAAVRRNGRIPVPIAPEASALIAELSEGRPVLILQNLRLASWPAWHYAVVVGYEPERGVFLLRSGRTERLATPAAELRRTWALAGNWGLVVLRPGELPASDDPARYLEALAALEGRAEPAGLIAAYRAALTRWPEDFTARFGLANALRESGDLAGAERVYRSLLAERPGEPAVVNNLADLLIRRGRPRQALSLLDAVLAQGGGGALRPTLEQTRGEARAARAVTGSAPTAQPWSSPCTTKWPLAGPSGQLQTGDPYKPTISACKPRSRTD